jgi:hypothetical protein
MVEVHLNRDSIVDQRTGEIETPSEYMANLRSLETGIARTDEEINSLKADLKAAKDRREKLVAQLRAGIREGAVLPLLEVVDRDGVEVDEDGTLDSEDD